MAADRPWVWIEGGQAQDSTEGLVILDTDVLEESPSTADAEASDEVRRLLDDAQRLYDDGILGVRPVIVRCNDWLVDVPDEASPPIRAVAARELLVALYPEPDRMRLRISHVLRMLPRAGVKALDDGEEITVEEWATEHEGGSVASLITMRTDSQVGLQRTWEPDRLEPVWDGFYLSQMRFSPYSSFDAVAVSSDGNTLVATQRAGKHEVLWVFSDFTDVLPCHPSNPWCEYSPEPRDEAHAETGPWPLTCVVHAGGAW